MLRIKTDNSNSVSYIPFLALFLIIIFLVGAITYALYVFVRISNLSNKANLHLSKNLVLAEKSIQGNLYSNEALGIKDWVIYRNESNHFEIKYPNDWEIVNDEQKLFSARLLNKQTKGQSSLAMNVSIGSIKIEDGSDFASTVKDNERELSSDRITEEQVWGKNVLHAKKHQEESGFNGDTYYIEMENEILYVRAQYYNANSIELEQLFQKIIEEFKII
jgi:hypothetical protein